MVPSPPAGVLDRPCALILVWSKGLCALIARSKKRHKTVLRAPTRKQPRLMRQSRRQRRQEQPSPGDENTRRKGVCNDRGRSVRSGSKGKQVTCVGPRVPGLFTGKLLGPIGYHLNLGVSRFVWRTQSRPPSQDACPVLDALLELGPTLWTLIGIGRDLVPALGTLVPHIVTVEFCTAMRAPLRIC